MVTLKLLEQEVTDIAEALDSPEFGERTKRKLLAITMQHEGAPHGFIARCLRISPGRQRYSVLGAIESHSKEFISVRTRGNVNSETVCELLEKICEAHPGEEVTLVMDNARYQHNKMVKGVAEAVEIELLFLPAYSPNLNLIERLWKLTKKRCLTNRYYENFDKFVEGIDECLDSFATTRRDEIFSLLTLNFQFFGNRNS